jgi:hypothetical protein
MPIVSKKNRVTQFSLSLPLVYATIFHVLLARFVDQYVHDYNIKQFEVQLSLLLF